MLGPVLLLDKVLAFFAFRRLGAAGLHVVDPHLYLELLLAVLALLRSQITVLFMVAELGRWGRMRAVLTLDWAMRLLFMFFTISFSHDLAALSALVVIARTPNLMHPYLTHFNSTLARRALLRFLYRGFRHNLSLLFNLVFFFFEFFDL